MPVMVSRRSLLWGGMAAMSGLFVEGMARAAVVRAVTLEDLVVQSQHAFVGTPIDSFSLWEVVGRRRRLVTYTRVRAEYSFDGRPPDDPDLMVRSLGGMVDGVGQVVPGEAVLRRGSTAALFVHRIHPTIFCVTAMAQGHYPLSADRGGVHRLNASPTALEAAPPQSAVQRLDQRTIHEAEGMVLEELKRAGH